MNQIKLNLGCGEKKKEGYINVDKFGNPDVEQDLDVFPWPWETNSIREIQLIHVLEHLGQQTKTYFKIFQEMYRICHHGSLIYITVPDFRHDHFHSDPSHVRVVTPLGLQLFSKKLNKSWIEQGASNSPLGIHLNVDFELRETVIKPSTHWFRLYPDENVDINLLQRESALYNNLIEEYHMILEVIKD